MDDLIRILKDLSIKRSYYSSDKRKFGYYMCKDCNRRWQSAYSWEDYGQRCKGCGKKVKAYKREDLLVPEENKIDPNKPHIRRLCEKCKALGDCTQRGYY